MLNYLDDTHQDLGFFGFDMFGLCSASAPRRETQEIFSPTGCSYLIDANVFKQVGMFDRRFFMYSEEVDLTGVSGSPAGESSAFRALARIIAVR